MTKVLTTGTRWQGVSTNALHSLMTFKAKVSVNSITTQSPVVCWEKEASLKSVCSISWPNPSLLSWFFQHCLVMHQPVSTFVVLTKGGLSSIVIDDFCFSSHPKKTSHFVSHLTFCTFNFNNNVYHISFIKSKLPRSKYEFLHF